MKRITQFGIEKVGRYSAPRFHAQLAGYYFQSDHFKFWAKIGIQAAPTIGTGIDHFEKRERVRKSKLEDEYVQKVFTNKPSG